MLLNLSNHPSTHWPQPQTEAATAAYESIQDLPFPQIDPTWTSAQIGELADRYLQKIQALQPTAVHIMGELTFTFNLVQKLLAAGIPCVASTTERLVSLSPDGAKTSTFRFVAFRPY